MQPVRNSRSAPLKKNNDNGDIQHFRRANSSDATSRRKKTLTPRGDRNVQPSLHEKISLVHTNSDLSSPSCSSSPATTPKSSLNSRLLKTRKGSQSHQTSAENSGNTTPNLTPRGTDSSPREFQIEAPSNFIDQFGEKNCIVVMRLIEDIAKNRVQLLSPTGWNISYCLKQENLYEAFFYITHHLIKNDLIFSDNSNKLYNRTIQLIKTCLQIINQPFTLIYLNQNNNVKFIAEEIIQIITVYIDDPSIKLQLNDTIENINIDLKKVTPAEDAVLKGLDNLKKIPKDNFGSQHEKLFDEIEAINIDEIKELSQEEQTKTFINLSYTLFNTNIEIPPLRKQDLFRRCFETIIDSSTHPLFEIRAFEKKCLKILGNPAIKYLKGKIQFLALYAKKAINFYHVGLRPFLLLLHVMKNNLNDTDCLLNICAGSRKWDPKGDLFLFVISRIHTLQKQQNTHDIQDQIQTLFHFAKHWRNAPANQDLMSTPIFMAKWNQLVITLKNNSRVQDPPSLELLKELPEATQGSPSSSRISHLKHSSTTILKSESPSPTAKKSSPRSMEGENKNMNPLFLRDKKVSFWISESKAPVIHDTILKYMTETWFKVTVTELTQKDKLADTHLSQHKKRFNDISRFVTEQILQSKILDRALERVDTFCKVQKQLINEGAFEVACAIHAGISHSSINRLHSAFATVTNFNVLFVDKETSLTTASSDSKALRKKQKKHPHPFEFTGLVVSDIEHIEEGNADFNGDGSLNLNKFILLGAVYNRVIDRQTKAREFWETQTLTSATEIEALFPSYLYDVDRVGKKIYNTAKRDLKNAIKEKNFEMPEEENLTHEDVLWLRSNIIHQMGTKLFWGRNPEDLQS